MDTTYFHIVGFSMVGRASSSVGLGLGLVLELGLGLVSVVFSEVNLVMWLPFSTSSDVQLLAAQ